MQAYFWRANAISTSSRNVCPLYILDSQSRGRCGETEVSTHPLPTYFYRNQTSWLGKLSLIFYSNLRSLMRRLYGSKCRLIQNVHQWYSLQNCTKYLVTSRRKFYKSFSVSLTMQKLHSRVRNIYYIHNINQFIKTQGLNEKEVCNKNSLIKNEF